MDGRKKRVYLPRALEISTSDGLYYVVFTSKNYLRLTWSFTKGVKKAATLHVRMLDDIAKFLRDPSFTYKRLSRGISLTRTTVTKLDGSRVSVASIVTTTLHKDLKYHVPMLQNGQAIDWFTDVVIPAFREHSRAQNEEFAKTRTISQDYYRTIVNGSIKRMKREDERYE